MASEESQQDLIARAIAGEPLALQLLLLEHDDRLAGHIASRLPKSLRRTVDVEVRWPGFRTRELVAVTTLLDPAEFPAAEVAVLYRLCWFADTAHAPCTSSECWVCPEPHP